MGDDDFMPPPSFFEERAKDCRCCECTNPPCEGVCAGGVCDGLCVCRKDDFDFDDDDDGPTSGERERR